MIDPNREILYGYRAEQAMTTLSEAEKMLSGDFTPRSIVNRAYYAMFYMTLALFLKTEITTKTSKHSGVLAAFDKEFVARGRISNDVSKMIHRAFNRRIDYDYKEDVISKREDAEVAVRNAREFITALQRVIDENITPSTAV